VSRVVDLGQVREDADREREAMAAGHDAYVALLDAMAEEGRRLKADAERNAAWLQVIANALGAIQGADE